MSLAGNLIKYINGINESNFSNRDFIRESYDSAPFDEQCPYSEGGSYDPGDHDTPPESIPPNCTIGHFMCPFDSGEFVRCPIYQLKEGFSDDLSETFCFDSEIKDGKVFCRVDGKPCSKTKDIEDLTKTCGGSYKELYEQNCPIQVHDEKADVRPGKSEENMVNY